MSAIGKAIKLFAIGGSLITTNTIWLFGDGKVKKEAKEDKDENINRFDGVEKLKNRNGAILKDTKFTRGSIDSTGLNFTYQGTTTKKILMISQWPQMSDFEMKSDYYATTHKQYKDFNRSSIQIQLFDKPVWHNDQENTTDTYKDPLTQDQMNELFKDKDEVRVKQLLHSLQQRREWYFHYKGNETLYYATTIKWPGKYDTLTNVKVRYFSDFSKFKDYVHSKVDTCTDPKRSCVAHMDELDTMETDQESFFRSDYSG